MPIPTPPLTVTANLLTLLGNSGDTKARIKAILCGYQGSLPKMPGIGFFSSAEAKILAGSEGAVSLAIWPNDVISPPGTFYCIEIIDGNQVAISAENYQFTERGELDLSTVTPYDPNAVTMIVPVPYSPTPTFDGLDGTVFELTLSGDATITIQNMKPGQDYIFIIVQDPAGGHVVTWPANVKTPIDVNTVANGVTVVKYVCGSDNKLRLVLPPTFN